VPGGVDQALFVDFCNQNNPRARPRDPLNPGPRPQRLPPAFTTGWRRSLPETSLTARSRFNTAPAEVSRARGRPAFAARRLSPRFLMARASPQPDRLGHLVSWARDGTGWKADDAGRRCMCGEHTSPASVTSPPREPAYAMPATAPRTTRPREAAGPRNPPTQIPSARMGRLRKHHPGPRAASPDPPRRGPRSAAPEVPSIVGLSGGTGRYPQLVSNLWKTSGAFVIFTLPCRP